MDAAVAELRSTDSLVLSNFLGMQQDATDIGMEATLWQEKLDYRVPIDRAPERVINPPWLGEFKTTGVRRKRRAGLEWRWYFSEPVERANLVVVCGLGWKDPSESKAQGDRRQDDDIRRAMKLFQRYCSQEGLSYPPFEST